MTNLRSSSVARELLIELRRDVRIPFHRQVETAIRDRIRSGQLPAGTSLPSTRALAADLGLSRGVVTEAYQQLTAEGYLVSRSGGYTQVALGAATRSRRRDPEPAGRPPPRIDFRYGRPDVSQFPRAAWLRSMRRALTAVPNERLVYLDGLGSPELRSALTDYLNRVRGTSAQPEHVVITNGFAQGIRVVAEVLAAHGARKVAVEDPSSDDDLRVIAPTYGVEVIGIPVDESGISVPALEKSGADAVVVTAAHQFPTGAVLPPRSRTALVEWAVRRGGVIIEDDYDAEYRYDRDPIGAIQGLAPDHVIYAGTASKTLAPGLRLGWLVVPDRMVADIAAAKVVDDRGSPVLEQLTFADFVSRGDFDRHLRRMRPRYRGRRDALLSALRARLPDLEPIGISAGLHVVTWLPSDLDEASVIDAAAQRGLGVYGVRPYRLADTGPDGLLFGYGSLSESSITEGIDLLADAIASVRSGSGG